MEKLTLYVLFDHPIDYPDHYVIRCNHVVNGVAQVDKEIYFKHIDITRCRNLLRNSGLTCMARDPNDDPKIIESWI